MVRLVAVLFAVAACGGGGGTALPDAGDAGAPDAPGFAACSEFLSPKVTVPAMVEGTLDGADVESPLSCETVDAPYGVESAGPDRVVPIDGLTAGSAYVVKLSSPSDLGFYVASGCATETGPAADQCLVFEDASQDATEVARFVATGPEAYVVVDFYASHAPDSVDFSLKVYAEECRDGTGCDGATPACAEGRCVECETSFDCSMGTASRCDAPTHRCEPGVDACTSDDATEPTDDGPAGARVLMPYQGHAVASGKICSSPASEADFFAFDVGSLGETWDFTLVWAGTRDLDLELYDANGAELGLSYWEQPERVRLTYLPIGRYYARLREFASDEDASPVAYTIDARVAAGPGCTAAEDCAREYRNQLFRGSCEAGACVRIDGDGAIAEGGRCDSQSDCTPELYCPSFFFVADGDTRETCAPGCAGDDDCDPSEVCTTYFEKNFCVPKCEMNDHCPTALAGAPDAGPWYRLACDVPSGHCM